MAKTLLTDPSTQPLAGTTLWILSTSRMCKRSSPFFPISKAGIFKFVVALYVKYFVIRCTLAMGLDGDYEPVCCPCILELRVLFFSVRHLGPVSQCKVHSLEMKPFVPFLTLPRIPIPAARHCVSGWMLTQNLISPIPSSYPATVTLKRDLTKTACASWAEIRMSPEFNGSSSSDGFYGPFLL